jgi:serine/threonine protein kinase/tetratricopeptide (TPR) repeat protein
MVSTPGNALEDFVRAFETAQGRDGGAAVEEFLPEPGHPLYRRVLRELIGADLTYGWKQGRPRRLEVYQAVVPALFQDREALQEVAYREYCLRLEAGDGPTPQEYERRFGIDTGAWPKEEREEPTVCVRCLPSGQQESSTSQPVVEEEDRFEAVTSHQEIRLQTPEDLSSWKDSFRGSPEHAGLFLDIHRSDPETASRLAQAVTAMPEVGTEFLGFRLLRELGRGAFARVYLCQQGELANRYVALKVSPGRDTETQTLAQLQHTNVVPIYSVHRPGVLQAVCMPYFGSTTLATVLKDLHGRDSLPESGKGLISTLVERKNLTHKAPPGSAEPASIPGVATPETAAEEPADQATPRSNVGSTSTLEMLKGLSYVEAVLWMMARLADGLAHAHERGILHRDLKPANILLTDEGQPMLLDFNLAQDTKRFVHPSVALIGGTLPFMAPEQLDAVRAEKSCPDCRSDIYSLGVIFYELLVGRHPFETHTGPFKQVLESMIANRLQPPPRLRRWNRAISPAVESIVRHCLEPDPARRYQTARQLQEDLERQLEHLPLKHAPEGSWRERVRKFLRRHPRLTSSTSVAVVAVVVVVMLASSLTVRAQRLAGLEAAASWQLFEEEMRNAQFLVTTRSADAEQLDAGIRTARGALDRYQVIDNASWQTLPAVQRLPEEDQARLREEAPELLMLLSQAISVQATGAADSSQQAEQLRLALRFNQRAEACFGNDQASRALLLQRAEIAGLLGQDPEARRLRAEASQVPMRTPTDYYLVATEHVAHGRYREAVSLLQEVTQQDPENFWAWFQLGSCHDNLTQDAEAVACYSACMGLRPRFPWSFFNRGLAYLRKQSLKQASADFDQVIQLRPEVADAYINRALARHGMGNSAGAIDDLTRALDLGAPYTRVYFMRARIRDKAGDHDGAKRDMEAGLRLEPTDEKSWIARGMARLDKDIEGAHADFTKALDLNPRSLMALQNIAHVLSKQNRNVEAIKVLDKIVRLYPDYVSAQIGRGVLLARLGKREAAHKDAEDVLFRDNKPGTLYQAACIFALTSRTEAPDRREAFRLLASALGKGYGVDAAEKDRDLEPIRNEPEYRKVVEGARAIQASAAGKN